MAAQTSSTKSIDVGSMFLMDLSVHESSELNCGDVKLNDTNALDITNVSSFPSGSLQFVGDSKKGYRNNSHNQQQPLENNRSKTIDQQQQQIAGTHSRSIAYKTSDHHHRINDENQALQSNSSDNQLTSAVKDNCDNVTNNGLEKNIANNKLQLQGQQRHSHDYQLSIVEQQARPEIIEHQLTLSANSSASSSTSSLSDESFMANSSGDESLIASSYTASDVDEERASTTTREDSGVLDIKDLDSRLNNSYDNEHEEEFCQQQQQKTLNHQEKPIKISINATTVTNLTNNKSANNSDNIIIINNNQNNIDHNDKIITKNPINTSRPNKPTNSSGSSNNHHHHNPHHHRNSQSKCTISASLPIEVPVRQMKKNFNKSKLNSKDQGKNGVISNKNKRMPAYNAMNAAIDDFEDFLEQEYNDNHHNHYPIDEFDEEHVRAEENPMKLFESIQALARSLHEDTELFGSLPPKRLLESPIRSLALA